MFTIKHITDAGEELYEGDNPLYTKHLGYFSYRSKDGTREILWGGEVYVMNDIGKTVAHYSLVEMADRQQGRGVGTFGSIQDSMRNQAVYMQGKIEDLAFQNAGMSGHLYGDASQSVSGQRLEQDFGHIKTE